MNLKGHVDIKIFNWDPVARCMFVEATADEMEPDGYITVVGETEIVKFYIERYESKQKRWRCLPVENTRKDLRDIVIYVLELLPNTMITITSAGYDYRRPLQININST